MKFYPKSQHSVFLRDPLIRSFFSEETLVANRDVAALSYKWSSTAADRVVDFIKDPFYKPPDETVYIQEDASPISGRSGATKVDFDEPVLGLHVAGYGKPEKIRSDLRELAANIGDYACGEEVVLGVTYSEVARFAMRLGFKQMGIIGYDEGFSRAVETRHRAFRAINPARQDKPFELAAVYLPVEEFVTKFGV